MISWSIACGLKNAIGFLDILRGVKEPSGECVKEIAVFFDNSSYALAVFFEIDVS